MSDPTNPSHYRHGQIDPWDYIFDHDMGFHEGNIIKYLTRWRHKNGIEDLEKAQAYLNDYIKKLKGRCGDDRMES